MFIILTERNYPVLEYDLFVTQFCDILYAASSIPTLKKRQNRNNKKCWSDNIKARLGTCFIEHNA